MLVLEEMCATRYLSFSCAVLTLLIQDKTLAFNNAVLIFALALQLGHSIGKGISGQKYPDKNPIKN